jgi:hypothetical protein
MAYACAHDDDNNAPCDDARAAFKAAEQVYRLSWTQGQRVVGSDRRRQRRAAPTRTHSPDGFPGLLDLGPGAAPPPADVAVAVSVPALGEAVTVHSLSRHPGAFHVIGALSAQQQVRCCHAVVDVSRAALH